LNFNFNFKAAGCRFIIMNHEPSVTVNENLERQDGRWRELNFQVGLHFGHSKLNVGHSS
jgi:hypothetical protein